MAAIISPNADTIEGIHEVPVPATTTNTTKKSLGIDLPFVISNDADFVASTLKQRDTLEVLRAAKSMLYDAYMKAVKEHGA